MNLKNILSIVTAFLFVSVIALSVTLFFVTQESSSNKARLDMIDANFIPASVIIACQVNGTPQLQCEDTLNQILQAQKEAIEKAAAESKK